MTGTKELKPPPGCRHRPNPRSLDVGTTNQNSPVRRQRTDPAVIAERKRIFVQELATHGVFRYAAAAASGHIVGRNGFAHDTNCGEQTFAQWMKQDPAFAEEVRAALQLAIGNLEKKLIDRIDVPNVRPVFDKQGNRLGEDVNWRDANVLLLRALERHDPAWIVRKQIDGTTHVITSDADVGSGASYVLKPADIVLLPPEKQMLLVSLLEEIEQAREDQPPAIPAAAPAALPEPENHHG